MLSSSEKQANLPVHSAEQNEYLSRPHMCDTCGKRFTLLENLNRHQMIHTDERPYLCTFCQKRFRLAQHLKEHIRIHTGEKPYKCNECGRAFCQISNLKSHQKTHTKIKAFRCDICGKSFRRSFTLKQHRLTHTRNFANKSQQIPNGPRSAPPTQGSIDAKPQHARVSRKRSAPETYGPYYDKTVSSSYYSEQSSGLAMLSAIGAQMSRYSPSTSATAAQTIPTYQPPLSAPLIGNVDGTKERYVFPSLTALLTRDDGGSAIVPRSQYNTALPGLSTESLHYYSQQYSNLLGGKQNPLPKVNDDATSTQNCVEKIKCDTCSTCFDTQFEYRRHMFQEHSQTRLRRDSAYSSHDDKSLPNSPESLKMRVRPVGGSVDNLQQLTNTQIKQEHHSDDDVIKSDSDGNTTRDKATKSGAKWKQQLCKGWYDHELKECHHTSPPTDGGVTHPTERTAPRQDDGKGVLCDISPPALVIDSQKTSENEAKGIQLQENKSTAPKNEPSSAPVHQESVGNQPTTFGMDRMVPLIEWKPVVTGWRDVVTGYTYPMFGPQMPTKYLAPNQQTGNSNQPFGTPQYFNFSPNMLHAYAMPGADQMGIGNPNPLLSVITPPSEETMKYGIAMKQDTKNVDQRPRLYGTSHSVDHNLLIAK